jgi:Family of unknown function (DUF6325)
MDAPRLRGVTWNLGVSASGSDTHGHPAYDQGEATTFTPRANGTAMSNSLDRLGPVDYLIVEFPADTVNFTGKMVDELLRLAENGTIRVIDILVLIKDLDGRVEAIELDEFADLGRLQIIQAELADLLTEDDLVSLAIAMEPGSTAGLLVYENVWAAPFASAVRHSGGRLVVGGRIPIQAIVDAMEADEPS